MFYAKYPLAVSLAAFAFTQHALAADTPAAPECAQYEKLLTRAELAFKNVPICARIKPDLWGLRKELAEHGIGHLDGEPVYLLELKGAAQVEGCHWQGLRAFMLGDDHTLYKVLGYAAQIGTWAREHRFCGSCGQAMTQVRGERAMYCATCDLRSYPRISPSMIVLITRGDEVLLARSPRFVPGV